MCATYDWSYNRELSHDEVCRRASARRKYNALRRDQADIRRAMLMQYILELGDSAYFHGVQSHLAAKFRVHRSTICRDLKRLGERNWAMTPVSCPACGSRVPMAQIDKRLRLDEAE